MTSKGKVFWAKTAVILGAIPLIIWAHDYGPDPGKDGVPGESNCTESLCHVGTAINGGGGSVSVAFPGSLTYVPGVKQHLVVTIADPVERKAGFQLTARASSNTKTQAGDFSSTDLFTLVLCSDTNLNTILELDYPNTQTCPSKQPLSYIEHNLTGASRIISSGTENYEFDWTPPATSVGNIVIYVEGNGANGDGTERGDHIYSKTYTLTPGTASNAPVISSVVGNATGQPVIAPNTYVNILGSNLSTQTDLWTVNGTTLPTTTDGVSVTVGGKAAYMEYVSPTQVQVLTPPDLGFGQVAVQLTNSNGTSSSVTVTSQQFAPAFFQWVNNQPVATRADNSDAMKNGSYAGLTTVPAKPGEYVVFWGTGFGPTTPATPNGTLVPGGSTIYYVSTVPTLTINNQPMAYYATALSPSFGGLYQVVAQVPANMPNGDWPVVATVGGVSSPAGVLLTVQK